MRVVSTPVVPRLAASILFLIGLQLAVPDVVPAKAAEAAQLDPERVVRSVVGITATVPADSQSARTLGTDREGSGVVIDGSGLILTIGYTVMEASQIQVIAADGRSYPANMVAYDTVSGFGLLRAEMGFSAPWLRLAGSDAVKEGDTLLALSGGGNRGATAVKVVGKREFAGYWEYLLDDAIFTAPAHPNWGGTALLGSQGELLGIGSLQLQYRVQGGRVMPLNMSVPIDQLKPILDDMLTLGRVSGPSRPWLGLYATEDEQSRIVLVGLAGDGPAQKAELRVGDAIRAIAGNPVTSLADFYRALWALGPAGVDVPLTLEREGDVFDVRIGSADRNDFLKVGPRH